VANCSDGAKISGARPLDPEAVAIDGPAVDRAHLVAGLEGTLRQFAPGEILRDRDFPELVRQTKDLYREIHELLDGFDREAADFGGIYRSIKDYLIDAPDRLGNVDSMMSGTLFALPRIGMFYGYRVEAGEPRRKIFDIYMFEMREILREMERQTIDLFERLAAGSKLAPAAECVPAPVA
jgi:hypothetical protein